MTTARKTILKEISLWKRRFNSSKKALNDAYKDVAKDARKIVKEVVK